MIGDTLCMHVVFVAFVVRAFFMPATWDAMP